ncbi:Nucleoside-diphosphate-sugar epimerase [uncultured Pleomorphomonas sp.]|uniref:Nucleoside-diphosphate-sugar epimerase n=1 Tax=uncultured Pleomorphomonas sp. TaxID=442121 RepID=A0A212KXU0_9HYPH|nr:aldehyde reductase [uncultured Pleomorphomonas sp.]SCM70090.1 Nucleoside-diphosphate-sugar epimerase [uncultured Pleomorphomonas sp.]
MVETVLVTGGTGFVAGWCIVELLKRGYAVRTTLRSLSKQSAVLSVVAAGGVPVDRLSFAEVDLTDDRGWDAAMTGCDYVLHVASPLGRDAPRDRDALVAPARDGTLRVLRAGVRAGVKRIVMTSAATAARPPRDSEITSDEKVWADPDDSRFDAYRRSKILAERAAWDFMKTEGGSTEFVTILPGAILGPVLTKDNLGSVQIIERLLQGRPGRVPRIGLWVVDVRDLAELHIQAMIAPEAAGERFLAVGDFMWMEDIAKALRARLGGRAKKVPTRRLPNLVFKFMAVFMPVLRSFTAELGRRTATSSEKASRVLGFSPRPGVQTVVDCAESLRDNGR